MVGGQDAVTLVMYRRQTALRSSISAGLSYSQPSWSLVYLTTRSNKSGYIRSSVFVLPKCCWETILILIFTLHSECCFDIFKNLRGSHCSGALGQDCWGRISGKNLTVQETERKPRANEIFYSALDLAPCWEAGVAEHSDVFSPQRSALLIGLMIYL